MSPSADPKWIPEIPEEDQLAYDPEQANPILDEARYMDTDGDGIREMPDGTNPLVIRHAVNTDGDLAGSIGDLMVGWMEEIGIGVELEAYDQDALFGVIVEGTYDTFFWGWVPSSTRTRCSLFHRGRDRQLQRCQLVRSRIRRAVYGTNPGGRSGPEREIVHEMLTMFHDAAVYIPMYIAPDLQAYRTDTFEGWVKQPAEIGPVMFSNTSPSYVQLTPIGADAGGVGHQLVALGGHRRRCIVIAGVFLAMRNRSTADERE